MCQCVLDGFWSELYSWHLYSLNEAADMKLERSAHFPFASVLGCASWHDQPNCQSLMAAIKHALAHFAPTCRKNCSNCPFPQLLVLAHHWRRLGDLNFGGGGVSPAPDLSADGWVYMPHHYLDVPPVRHHCSP